MKILDFNSLGGTCDRCGKGLVNVAYIEVNGKTQTVGLDCLNKVKVSDFQVKRQISQAIKDARELGTMKKLLAADELQTKYEQAGGGPVAYWYHPKQGWKWVGLAEQNRTGLRKEIWDIIANKY